MPLEGAERVDRGRGLEEPAPAELGQVDDEGAAHRLAAERRDQVSPASAVPPVARRSSTRSTFSPGRMASSWASSVAVPYSSW